MRVAALYDIHGNLPALEAVLNEVREAGVDAIVVGGDVLPGPMPREALEYLQGCGLPLHCLRGNGEREVRALERGEPAPSVPPALHDMMRWVARQLQPAQAEWLAAWPQTLRLPIAGMGDVLFCHATPRSDSEIFTRRTAEDCLRPLFDDLGVSTVICGHTHMPFDRVIGRTRVVNAGSVGMPFGAPGADWLLLGPAIEPHHTAYDLEAAARRIERTSYPGAVEFTAHYLLQPPSEAAMLDAFTRAELAEG